MLDVKFGNIAEHGYGDGVAGNFPHRQRRNKLRGMFGHNALDFGAALAQHAGDFSGLKRGDAAADGQDDFLVF
ncbi:Uncharacterised protein [uncultured Ruminococcus sp.]|nr:Uncharacterised protein [uncultured Ruminococcus sp.]